MTASNKDTLSRKDYKALKTDVEKLLGKGSSRTSDSRIDTYWQIGARISSERLTGRAGYHNSVLKELASDTGASTRTLQRAVTLHKSYKTPPTNLKLTWSHLRVILQLPTAAQRKHFTSVAIKDGLNPRELSAVIEDADSESNGPHALQRPTSPTYIFQASVHSVIDGDTLQLDIDLGFNVHRRQRVRLALLNCPELKGEKGREAKRFVNAKVLEHPSIVVKTIKVDLYGRYLAHVFLGKEGSSIESCFKRGIYLNNLLIESGHARKTR